MKKQGTKASADIACSGVLRPEPNAPDLPVDELEPSGNGPHLLDQPDDAVVMQARSRLAQPIACPEQHIVSELASGGSPSSGQASGACEW
jgi:hypothetical protein